MAIKESVLEAMYIWEKNEIRIIMLQFSVLRSINRQNVVNTINTYKFTQPNGVKKFTMCNTK